jgi:glycosyltransferase involved in cell wall biosynthesis
MSCFDVVIPARNEESSIAGVIEAALRARGVGRVVVADDGSGDETAARARRAGAQVVAVREPGAASGDKGSALAAGVAATRAPVLVFFDADLSGVHPEHFEGLAEPVLAGESWLSCGLIDYGSWRRPFFLRLPPITGLRALRREVFLAIPERKRRGFQIEIMINEAAVRRDRPTSIRVLPGLRHRTKIEKMGWWRGLPAHLRMTAELLGCLRFVPLWTYLAYLRNLTILPAVRIPGSTLEVLREVPHPREGSAT